MAFRCPRCIENDAVAGVDQRVGLAELLGVGGVGDRRVVGTLVGIGEQAGDFGLFDATNFTDALLGTPGSVESDS